MERIITPGSRRGTVSIPSSKSVAHRLLICAALSDNKSTLVCDGISKDVMATVNCLRSLGAKINIREERFIDVEPIGILESPGISDASDCVLPCNESGSTLRFLLPVAAALGRHATFEMAGGLAARPMNELLEALEQHGVRVTKGQNTVSVEGKLEAGRYTVPGNISSQYISGLLFALPLLNEDSELIITQNIESADYITMTEAVLKEAGINIIKIVNEYRIQGKQNYRLSGTRIVEPDWSNAAFFLCMGALSTEGVTVHGMNLASSQGDREILKVLQGFGADIKISSDNKITVNRGNLSARTVDASDIPDLVPTISALASVIPGTTRIINAERLRIKESDRLKTTSAMLRALGADVREQQDGLIITGREKLEGGTADAANDHRIAMAAAVAACVCKSEVIVTGAECVAKSYPKFWEHFEGLETES